MKKVTTSLFTFILITGCAHKITPVAFSHDQKNTEVMQELSAKLNGAFSASADVLAPKSYEKGYEYYMDTKMEIEDSDFERHEFLEDAGLSMAYFNKALDISKKRMGTFESIVSARSAAVKSGARLWKETKAELNEIDMRVKKIVSNTSSEIEVEILKELEGSYYELKGTALIKRNLSYADDSVNEANSWGADNKAPDTFRKLKSELASAKNMIRANSSSPEVYNSQVEKALINGLLMRDVMETIDKNGGDVKENVALNLIRKDRLLDTYKDRISGLKQSIDTASTMIGVMDDTLEEKNKLLTIQEKVERLKSMLTEDEAEVIQKGSDIVIRLKKIKFTIGKSSIPEQAKSFLKKVSKEVEAARPESIVILGHTDTTGSKEFNSYLSRERASKVAEYIKDNSALDRIKIRGMSYKAPLTANVDKKARSQNRRVDIVLKSIN